MYWDGKPYVPSFINDFVRNRGHLLDPDAPVEELKEDIDKALQSGITDFWIEVSYLGFSSEDAELVDKRIKAATEYIHASGGTYFLVYSSTQVAFLKALKQQEPTQYDKYMKEFDEYGFVSTRIHVKDMLGKKMLEVLREDMRHVGSIATTPGLRGISLIWEINSEEAITADTPEELMDNLETGLNVYGKMAKEEIGDVPVVFIGASEGMRPYLTGLRAENIDGIVEQYSQPTPESVHALTQRRPIVLRVLNSCPQTKVYWAYAQGRLSGSYFLYPSKDLMRGHYMAMIEGGVTGFPFDQYSSSGLTTIGLPEDSPELRQQNHQWWGELQPEFEAEILRRAKNHEFSTGKWAVPIKKEDWQFPSSNLKEEEVEIIANNHPDVKRLLGLGADIGFVQFFPDYSAWLASVSGERGENAMVWGFWIDDSDGKVVINGFLNLENMRKAGYPIPSNEWLINFSKYSDDFIEGCTEDWEEMKCCQGESCTDMTCGSGCVVEGCDENCKVVCTCG